MYITLEIFSSDFIVIPLLEMPSPVKCLLTSLRRMSRPTSIAKTTHYSEW